MTECKIVADESADYSLSGSTLMSIKAITSLNGKWSIADDGTIVAVRLCLEEICIDKNQLKLLLEKNGLLNNDQSPNQSAGADGTGQASASDQSSNTQTTTDTTNSSSTDGAVSGTDTTPPSDTPVDNTDSTTTTPTTDSPTSTTTDSTSSTSSTSTGSTDGTTPAGP